MGSSLTSPRCTNSFRGNEVKTYWEELLEGKYEWSSISKQLRQKGLVK